MCVVEGESKRTICVVKFAKLRVEGYMPGNAREKGEKRWKSESKQLG